MPEAPDLEVIKNYLNHRAAGLVVCSAKVLRPTVIRSLAGDFPTDVQGRTLDEFRRQGKFLLALRRDASGRWLIAADMDNAIQRR